MDQVRAQALEGLRLITIEIGSQRNYNFIEPAGWSIRRETQQEFEATTEWQEFEDELLALADSKRRFFPDPFLPDASAQPLGDNPFPPDHPAHAAFEEATWKAKGTIAKLKLELLGSNCNTKAEFIRSLLTFRKRWFTASAFEATLIVGNEQTAQWYEHWIGDRASWFLEDTLTRFNAKDPRSERQDSPFFSAAELEDIETDLRLELMRMVAHYKGVAAARVVEVIGLRNTARAAAVTGFSPGGKGMEVERNKAIEIDANITDQQKELLRFLVSQDTLRRGEEFIHTRNLVSAGISYAGGFSVHVPYALSDFQQLQSEKLITFYPISQGVWRGKPTQLGLISIPADAHPERGPAGRSREQSPAETADDPKKVRSEVPKLNVALIAKWMEDEGYDNKELAIALKISVRTVSSLRNDGDYHGDGAVTKLANLMKREVEDLYLS